jgi:serine/threonine-protein kinase
MHDLRSRLTAALAGRYDIERELGAGGMATVYLAQDVKHHRAVAVKVLRPEIATTLGAARFFREIEVAAQLQHPHILPLLDSGETDGFFYYVMPLVEGESLRARLEHQGEFPVHDAVRILKEVVDALAHAHAHGVVHRDIKPDNILLSGRHALVMDFGVAKAVSEATGGGRQSITTAGVALGTPAYMAPEQAAADPHLDHRVDVYAVGALAYELLSGRPPFIGLSPQEVLAAHVTQAPDPLDKHRAGLPPSLTRVIMRCLAKRPADRWQTAEELLAQLEPLITPSGGITPTGTHPTPAVARANRWLRITLGVAALGIVAVGARFLTRPTPSVLSLGKVTQLSFQAGLEIEPAISPDGKLVVYAGGPLSAPRIYVQQPGGRPVALAPTPATGSERRPLWSPDGTRILFETDQDLLVMPAIGGAPRVTARGACCAAWSPDGRQVAYVRSPRRFGSSERPESIFVMPPDGGPARFVALVFDPHSLSWSPDGRWLALVSGNDQFAVGTGQFANKGPSAILLLPVAGGAPVAVTDNAALNVSPAWTPDGRHLLFVSDRDGARDVYAARLTRSGSPEGNPARITAGLNAHAISLSADGTRLAYSVYTARANVWALPIPTGAPTTADRATQITTGNQIIEEMTISPDGRWLYFDSNRSGNADLYRMALTGGEPQQITTDAADDFSPNLSPDGRRIAFHSLRFGTRDIFVMPAEGGEAQRVTEDPGEERTPHWSPDGRSLVYVLSGTGARDGPYVTLKDPDTGRWGAPARVGEPNNWVDWTPDGRSLLATRNDGVILVLPAGGGAPLRRYSVPDTIRPVYARWSADARTIYVKGVDRAGRTGFWALGAGDGGPRLLVRFDDPARSSSREEWATDGRRFYFTIDDRQSDIYVAELRGLK